MSNSRTNCPNCGGIIENEKCPYCGAEFYESNIFLNNSGHSDVSVVIENDGKKYLLKMRGFVDLISYQSVNQSTETELTIRGFLLNWD